ncbi:unnamed protein product [Anisakis simplex]|uniref:GYF domain-containing protein n=1 Tax=Anisakis simplex TaxID=6269 RepID=A0A0M3JA94_ANISI|nr:unnamed protein product [Anisakis simplex]
MAAKGGGQSLSPQQQQQGQGAPNIMDRSNVMTSLTSTPPPQIPTQVQQVMTNPWTTTSTSLSDQTTDQQHQTTTADPILAERLAQMRVGRLQHSMSQPAGVAPMGMSEQQVLSDDWYYIDPKNDTQGPFQSALMEAWFNSGYFTSDLRIRRGTDPNSGFITLGDLLRINGSISPFKRSPPNSAAIGGGAGPQLHIAAPPPQGLATNQVGATTVSMPMTQASALQQQQQQQQQQQHAMQASQQMGWV